MSDTNGNAAIQSNEDVKIVHKLEPKTQTPEKKEGEKTGKKGTKEKSIIVLTTKPISDQELRDALNKKFGEHNMYYKVLKEAVENLTKKHQETLRNTMTLVRQGVQPEFITKDGKITGVKFKKQLTDDELENYVVTIPVEMYFINTFMEDRALDMELADYMKEFNITEKILEIEGGTEKERLRAAEYNSMLSIFTSIIKNRVYYNLKNEIDAATKVYEALKKVMNNRIEEKKLFGSSGNCNGPKNK